ncbi:type II secretion system minor pseudopilin GspJ [Marinomonas sp. C2222]|uniref:Type II secretion system minor pseudopilin GspJ n=1 Tax=Marinomonas sargassi TaxID=2984494 RepID=A0ABT2YNJ5_9GAMM|nr:type II secretion system minor pseudopilin GspJ [Marinomonas sargassi]MCV2401458.1 type II secretion system minor pseudopilin GspJ [Marinomonas sargassi]
MKKMSGYILVETLISLVIMSVVGIAISDQIVNSNKVKNTVQKQSKSLEANFQILTRIRQDLLQVMNRSVRDTSGFIESAFIGMPDSLTFTKAGWPNPTDDERSTNQRVNLAFAGNQLNRNYYQVLDRANDSKKTKVFENVTSFKAEYMGYDLNWHPTWDSRVENSTPVAVKVTIQIHDTAPLNMIVELPSYQSRNTISSR